MLDKGRNEMSLTSWKKEFYKTPANKVSKRFALEHSLRKWIGLLPKNRKKHSVRLASGCLYEKNGYILDIDCDSCALCSHYFNHLDDCGDCPLSHADCNYAYGVMFDNKVVPMINLLKKALKEKKT